MSTVYNTEKKNHRFKKTRRSYLNTDNQRQLDAETKLTNESFRVNFPDTRGIWRYTVPWRTSVRCPIYLSSWRRILAIYWWAWQTGAIGLANCDAIRHKEEGNGRQEAKEKKQEYTSKQKSFIDEIGRVKGLFLCSPEYSPPVLGVDMRVRCGCARSPP